MFDRRGANVLLQLRRFVLLTVGLAPVVALGLIGLSRLRRDTPEWVYWKAELIFLIALELAYQVTVLLSLLGGIVFGFLLVRRSGQGKRRRWTARGFILCTALLCSVALSEAVCSAWLASSRRDTAVPVGGLVPANDAVPAVRLAQPFWHSDLRTNFSDPPGDRLIDLVVLGGSSARECPTTAGYRSARSSPGSCKRRSPIGRFSSTSSRGRETRSKSSTSS